MRRFILLLIILLAWAPAWAGMLIDGCVEAGGEPATGTVLFGDSSEYDTTTLNTIDDTWMYQNRTFTATWTESSTTTTASTIEVYCHGQAGGDLKAGIFDSDGDLISSGSGILTGIVYSADYEWMVITLDPAPTITKGSSYYIAICPSVNYAVQLSIDDTASGYCKETDGTYETPGTLSCDTTNTGRLGGIRVKK